MHKRAGLAHKDIALAAGRGHREKSALRVEHLEQRSSDDLRKALAKAGFRFVRQHKFKVELFRKHPRAEVVMPNRTRLSKGRMHRIAAEAGMTIEELKDLLVAVDREARRQKVRG